MSILLGHASIDERNKISGGVAGDQTFKEVVTRTWYNKPWSFILRCTNDTKRELMAQACEKGCNNNNIGYDQVQRNTLNTQAKKAAYKLDKITTPCETDCSAFMTVCAQAAGIDIPYNNGNAPTTSTMKNAFMSTGVFEVLTDSKYLTSDKYLKRGDILVKPRSHTVMALQDGSYNTDNTKSKVFKTIDVSHHNQITNWTKLGSEVDNIIIRMGYISYKSGVLTTDKKFVEHTTNAITQKLNIGYYVWDQSLNEVEAISLADYCVNAINKFKSNINLPIFIDSEYYNSKREGRADNISKEQRTKNILAFCKRIKSYGYVAGVYASDSWFKTNLIFDQIKEYDIWCARYSTNKPTIYKYDIWQYGSEQFSWAVNPIDVNIMYKDYSKNNKNDNNSNNSDDVINIEISNIVTANKLNVREKSNSLKTTKIKKVLNNGDAVDIIGYENGFYQIGEDQWVSEKYIQTSQGIVTASALFIRTGIGKKYDKKGVLKNKEIVNVLKAKDGWYLIKKGSILGWSSGKYITKYS